MYPDRRGVGGSGILGCIVTGSGYSETPQRVSEHVGVRYADKRTTQDRASGILHSIEAPRYNNTVPNRGRTASGPGQFLNVAGGCVSDHALIGITV